MTLDIREHERLSLAWLKANLWTLEAWPVTYVHTYPLGDTSVKVLRSSRPGEWCWNDGLVCLKDRMRPEDALTLVVADRTARLRASFDKVSVTSMVSGSFGIRVERRWRAVLERTGRTEVEVLCSAIDVLSKRYKAPLLKRADKERE